MQWLRYGLLVGMCWAWTGAVAAQPPGGELPAALTPPPGGGPIFVVPTAPPPPPLWVGSLELGILGASGNSDNFRFRFGGNVKSESPDHLWVADLVYNYAEAFGVRNENRAMFNTRYEWLYGDSPWSTFVSGQMEYDEFRAFDVRLAMHLGVAYTFVRTDWTLLKGRLGAGTSREIGGPNDRFIPEALMGLDFEHQFNDKTKFVSSFDYFPNITDWSDYRFQLRAALETVLVEEWNLSLKVGIFDRYDSTPEGRKPNDLEYFATLMWKF